MYIATSLFLNGSCPFTKWLHPTLGVLMYFAMYFSLKELYLGQWIKKCSSSSKCTLQKGHYTSVISLYRLSLFLNSFIPF